MEQTLTYIFNKLTLIENSFIHQNRINRKTRRDIFLISLLCGVGFKVVDNQFKKLTKKIDILEEEVVKLKEEIEMGPAESIE